MSQTLIQVQENFVEIHSALQHGSCIQHGEVWSAIPREVILENKGSSRKIQSVVFELKKPHDLSKPALIKVFLHALRLEKLEVILYPLLSMWVYGVFVRNWEPHWSVGLSSSFGVVFLFLAARLFNDIEDYLRLVDLPFSYQKPGVLQKGWMNAKDLKKLAYVILFLGIVFGIPAVVFRPELFLGVAALGFAGVLSYSSPPFNLKYRGWGDLAVFVFAGPLLMVGCSEAFFLQSDWGGVLIGCFYGFLAWSLVHLAHLPRLDGEGWFREKRGKTLASWIGFKKSRHLLTLLFLSAQFSLGLAIALGYLPISLFIYLGGSLLIVYPILKLLYEASGPASALLFTIHETSIQGFRYLGLGLSLCLLGATLLK